VKLKSLGLEDPSLVLVCQTAARGWAEPKNRSQLGQAEKWTGRGELIQDAIRIQIFRCARLPNRRILAWTDGRGLLK